MENKKYSDKFQQSSLKKKPVYYTINKSTSLKLQSILQLKNEIKTDVSVTNDELLDKVTKIFDKKIRSLNDIQSIANYLETLKEFIVFIKSSHINYRDLLVLISCFLKYNNIRKNEILFRFGKNILKFRRKRWIILHYI